MKRRATIIAAAMLAAAGLSATDAANAESLSNDALREAVVGKTVYLRTQGIELPIAYRSDGTMHGRLRAFAAAFSGDTATKDSGKWWVKNDQLCQRWRRWMDSQTYCYKLKRDGQQVQWRRNDGRSGTARIGG